MNNWEQLEEEVKKLLEEDSARRTPLSGATKKEEDVIGKTIIAQCKQTDNKNGSILNDDLKRLLDSCSLHDKFPLFFNEFNNHRVMSIPVTEETKDIIDVIIKIIISYKSIEKLAAELKRVQSLRDLTAIQRELNTPFALIKKICTDISNEKKRLDDKIQAIQDDILMHDLFEGEKNGTK